MKKVMGAVIMTLFIGTTCLIENDVLNQDDSEQKQYNIPYNSLRSINLSAGALKEGKTDSSIPGTDSILINKNLNYWIY